MNTLHLVLVDGRSVDLPGRRGVFRVPRAFHDLCGTRLYFSVDGGPVYRAWLDDDPLRPPGLLDPEVVWLSPSLWGSLLSCFRVSPWTGFRFSR